MSAESVAVLDAWAALAFLWREGAADVTVRRYLKRAESRNLRLVMSLVNAAEVFYRMIQMGGVEAAERRMRAFRQLPIEMPPVREPVALDAARIKAGHRLSLGDAFAVATARAEGAALLTGDPEILALPRKVVRVVRLTR
jgi:predicted nucleic acid-binding protein